MNKTKKENVLIVGAGMAGKELLAELKKYFVNLYEIKGFLDDNPSVLGKTISGVKVLGKIDEIENILRKENIDQVFIAIPSAQGQLIRKIIGKCEREKVTFKIVPRVLDIVQGKVKISRIRDVQPEDLLGRSIVKSEQSLLRNFFKGKTVFISGGAGSIGSEICRQIVNFNPKKLIIYDMWESGLFEIEQELIERNKDKVIKAVVGNVLDYKRVESFMKKEKPDFVFHAAAYKHVPLMQEYPSEAAKNNIVGTYNMAKSSYESGVKIFVNISTDKAVNPSCVMGATKKVAEHIVDYFNGLGKTKYCSVRFGNVLGSQGSIFTTFKRQIIKGGPITITSKKMFRYFMSIPEATQLVLNSALLVKNGGETFILDMGEPVNVDELAKLMIRMSGFVPGKDIKIKYTGIRSGEKINEKLYDDDEKLAKTANEKINVIMGNKRKIVPLEIVNKILDKSASDKNIVDLLKDFAPNI